MNINPYDITTSAYLFLIVGGVIALVGAIVAHLNKQSKRLKRRK